MVHGSAIELEKKHVPVPLYNQMDAEQNYDVQDVLHFMMTLIKRPHNNRYHSAIIK